MNKLALSLLTGAVTLLLTLPAMAGTIYTTYIDQGLIGGESALARIDTSTGAVTAIGLTGVRRVGALTYDLKRDRLLGIGQDLESNPILVELDRMTGSATIIGSLGQSINGSGGLAYVPGLDMLFGSDLVPGGDVFGQLLSIDPVTGQGSAIGTLQPHVASSFTYYPPTGQLLFTSGFEKFGAPFGSWDPVTGVQTTIGPTATIFGMDYDPDVDVLYGINGSFGPPGLGDRLFTIDPLTGQATLLVTLSRAEFYSSLAVIPDVPAPAGAVWMLAAGCAARRRRR